MDVRVLISHMPTMKEALANGVYYRITERGIFKYSCPRHECEFETVHLKGIRNHMFKSHPVIER
jgi:hypothetical protein